MRRYGLKLWSTDSDMADEAEELVRTHVFDYVELLTVPGVSVEPFARRAIRYVVHAPHESHSVNIADPSMRERNLSVLRESAEAAKRLHAPMIVHPGSGELFEALDIVRLLSEEGARLYVENMPLRGAAGVMVGYSPTEIGLFMRYAEFCLDVGHAIKTAKSIGVPPLAYIDELIELSPTMCHISDGHISIERDEHLRIGEGDYPIGDIMSRIPRMITIETPRTRRSLREAVEDLTKIREEA